MGTNRHRLTEVVKIRFRAQSGLRAALFLPYIAQTLDTEWNQGCQPSQLQGGDGLWLCHQMLLILAS